MIVKIADEHLIHEISELRNFCNNYEKVYIWGNGQIGKAISKLFNQVNINIAGHIVSVKKEDEGNNVFVIDEVDIDRSGIIMGCDDKFYAEILPILIGRNVKLSNIFFLSQSNKNNIVRRMEELRKEDFRFAVHLAEHCNLNCQMCTQFSPIAEPECMPFEVYERDCKRLSQLFEGNVRQINFTGGEPLLNLEVEKFICLTREQFPKAKIEL